MYRLSIFTVLELVAVTSVLGISVKINPLLRSINTNGYNLCDCEAKDSEVYFNECPGPCSATVGETYDIDWRFTPTRNCSNLYFVMVQSTGDTQTQVANFSVPFPVTAGQFCDMGIEGFTLPDVALGPCEMKFQFYCEDSATTGLPEVCRGCTFNISSKAG